nr:hypothetical protein [uncultured bacterium]
MTLNEHGDGDQTAMLVGCFHSSEVSAQFGGEVFGLCW